jgi:hypothetical protein
MPSPLKILLLLALLTLGLSFAACGDNPAASSSAASSSAESDDAEGSGAAANLLADPTAAAAGATGTSGTAGASACDESCSQSSACSEKCKESGSSCCDKEKGAEAASAACACVKGKAGEPVWCESCKKGYVDGKEVCCPSCVEDAKKKVKDGTQ